MPQTRRDFIKKVTAATATASVASHLAAQSDEAGILSKQSQLAEKPRRPNLLFLWTDQHRADVVPWAGDTLLRAPALKELAEQSFVFSRTYVTQPVCTPSRASMLTGTWPHTHGAVKNHIHLPKELKTVAECVSSVLH